MSDSNTNVKVVKIDSQIDFIQFNQKKNGTWNNPDERLTPNLAPYLRIEFGANTFSIPTAEYLFFEGYKRVDIVGNNRKYLVPSQVPGTNRTILKIGQTFNNTYNPSSQLTDDAVIQIRSEKDDSLEVNISDITLETQITREQVCTGNSINTVLNQAEMQFVKIINAQKLNILNVTSKIEYVKMSNFTLRACNNVVIRNCVIKNFTCRNKGSNIMLSNGCKNVDITNNDFYKFCNDECIWVDPLNSRGQKWIDSGNQSHYDRDDANPDDKHLGIENFRISGNRFYYTNKDTVTNIGGTTQEITYEPIDIEHANNGSHINGYDPNEGVWSGFNDVFLSICTSHSGLISEYLGEVLTEQYYCRPTHFTLKNASVSNNEFFINAPMYSLLALGIDRFTDVENINITDNKIIWNDWKEFSSLFPSNIHSIYLSNFRLLYDINYGIDDDPQNPYNQDQSKICDTPVLVARNSIKSVRKAQHYTFELNDCLKVEGMKAILEDNSFWYIDEMFETSQGSGIFSTEEAQNGYARRGFVVMRTANKGGELIARNNYFDGVKNIAITEGSSEQEIDWVKIGLFKNTFVGDTRSCLNNLNNGVIEYLNNTILSYYYTLLFEECAHIASVRFENNIVARIFDNLKDTSQTGQFYAHWGSGDDPIENLHLYCVNNDFHNIPNTYLYLCLDNNVKVLLQKINNKYLNDND